MNTAMRRNAYLLGDRGSRPSSGSGATENVDGPWLLPVFGRFSTTDQVGWRTTPASIWPQTRTVRRRGRVCGLCGDTDCSRTWSGCGDGLHRACSGPQMGRVGGRRRSISRGRSPDARRRIRGHKNLVDTRGHACPVLNTMRNTTPPLLRQFIAPLFQLRGDGLDSGGLLDGSGLGSRCGVVTQPGIWQLRDRIGAVVNDTFAEQVQHFDGGP